ncbi:MAG: hypothetical protein AAGK97_06160 [Bacteroidota bacterium]
MKSSVYIKFKCLTLAFCFLSCLGFGQVEICDNRIDDDGDGLVDCLDPDCNNNISCFACDPSYYQVHSNSALVLLDPFTGAYNQIGTISGVDQINAQAYNVLDGHVYAPAKIGDQQTLIMLNKDGSTVDLGLDLGTGGIYFVGGADDEGFMYLARGNSNVVRIDLKREIIDSYETMNISGLGIADFAFNVNKRKLYGVTGGSKLVEVDPITETKINYDLAGAINNDSGAFGAVWSNDSEFVFAYNNNSGKIYKIDLNDYTTAVVVNGTGNLSTNDGFNCINAPSPFESSCSNGTDDDGDGLADCDDPDCAADNVCLVEICDNGIDDDGDGLVDCQDTECHSLSSCIEICDNGIDDNGDGYID